MTMTLRYDHGGWWQETTMTHDFICRNGTRGYGQERYVHFLGRKDTVVTIRNPDSVLKQAVIEKLSDAQTSSVLSGSALNSKESSETIRTERIKIVGQSRPNTTII
jgi:hypothetical protein